MFDLLLLCGGVLGFSFLLFFGIGRLINPENIVNIDEVKLYDGEGRGDDSFINSAMYLSMEHE